MDVDTLQFRLLGGMEVEAGGRAVALGRRQERCLLGLLLLEPNRSVSVERLVYLLWADPGAGARATIRTYSARLRKCLRSSGVSLRRAGAGYLIEVDPARVDLHCFTTGVAGAARLADPRRRADALASALTLWRGPLLAGVADEALLARVTFAFDEVHARAVEQWAEAELDCGLPDVVVVPLRTLLAEDPYRERAVELLMLALYRRGQQADALRLYRDTSTTMIDQLGIEPGPPLRRMHEAILRGDEQLLTSRSPATSPATAVEPGADAGVARRTVAAADRRTHSIPTRWANTARFRPKKTEAVGRSIACGAPKPGAAPYQAVSWLSY